MNQSGIIIYSILHGNSRIISGDKGIGKSFTYLLYTYLASFILEVRLQMKSYNLNKGFFKKLFEIYDNFYRVQKLFYFPLRRLTNIKIFYRILRLQITEKLISEKVKGLKMLQPYECVDYYFDEKIKAFFVIDEINSFYSDARKYCLNLDKGKSNQFDLEDLQLKSKMLK